MGLTTSSCVAVSSVERFYAKDFPDLLYACDTGLIKTRRHRKHGDIAAKTIVHTKNRKRELEIIAKMNPHPNLVEIYGLLYKDRTDDIPIGYVMEHMYASLDQVVLAQNDNAPSNGRKVRRYSYKRSMKIAVQICEGIQCLHLQHIIHRDIKPNNVLVSEDLLQVKLCDYGISALYLDDRSLTAAQGTPFYMAPELRVITEKAKYTESCDVYSAAVTIYELVMKRKASYSETGTNALAMFMNGEVPTFSYGQIGGCAKFKEIIKKCWCKDPKQRPSINEVYLRLRSPYFLENFCGHSDSDDEEFFATNPCSRSDKPLSEPLF